MRALLAVMLLAAACSSPRVRRWDPTDPERFDVLTRADPSAEEGAEEVVDAGPPPPPRVFRFERTDPPSALSDFTFSEPRAQSYKLSNGIKLIVVENHRRRTVSVQLLLPEGAAADPASKSGATLFAVSLLGDRFDEKTPYGAPADADEKSARQRVAELGGRLMLDVSEDLSTIGVEGFAPDTGVYLKAISEVIRAARHGADSFAGRMDGVIAALNELDVGDDTVLEEQVGRLAFGEEHAYARPVYGTPQSIGALTLNEVADRQESLLSPAGATLLVVGDVKPDVVFRQAQAALGDWKAASPRQAGAVAPPQVGRRQYVTVLPRQPARTTIVCMGRALTGIKASLSAVQLLTGVLSERLSRALREEQGLTYQADAALVRHKSAQALIACARLRAQKTEAGLGSFLEVLSKTVSVAPSPDELERVRRGLIAQYRASLDDNGGIARMWRDAVVMQQPVSIAARLDEVRAVTADEVHALAGKVLKPELLQWVLSGEVAKASAAVKAYRLGKTRVPRLEKIADDEPAQDDMP